MILLSLPEEDDAFVEDDAVLAFTATPFFFRGESATIPYVFDKPKSITCKNAEKEQFNSSKQIKALFSFIN